MQLVQTYIWAKKFASSPTQATQHLGLYTFLTGHTVNLLDVLSVTNLMECFLKCRDGRIIFVRFCQTAKISVEKDLLVQKCDPMAGALKDHPGFFNLNCFFTRYICLVLHQLYIHKRLRCSAKNGRHRLNHIFM